MEVLQSSMACSTPHPTSCPTELPRAPPAPLPLQKKTNASSFPSTAGLRERNDDSLKLQERIEALLEDQHTSRNTRVQFGIYLMSMIPHIHESILIEFLDESHRLLLQYVHWSDVIRLQGCQQQQQQQQQPYHHLPPPFHHHQQQPFVSHDMFRPLPSLQPKYQQILFQQSFPVQPSTFTETRPVAHQCLVSTLPSNICSVTTSSCSTSTSTATSGGIFDPSVTLAFLAELQPVTPLTPSSSFLSDENVNLNTPQPGSQSD